MELDLSLDDVIAENPGKTDRYSKLVKKLAQKEREFLLAVRGQNKKFFRHKDQKIGSRKIIMTGYDLECDRGPFEAIKYARSKVLEELENNQVIEDLGRKIGERTCALPVVVRPDSNVILETPGDLKRYTEVSAEFPGALHASTSSKTSYSSKRVNTIDLKDTFIPIIEKRYIDKDGQFKKNAEHLYDNQIFILNSFFDFLIKHEISFFSLRKRTGNKITTFVKFPLGWPKVAHTHSTISIIPTHRQFDTIGDVLFNEKKKTLWLAAKLTGLFGKGNEVMLDFFEAQQAARKFGWPEPMLLDGDLITLPSPSDYI